MLKIRVFVGILVLLLLVNTCSATGLTLSVNPLNTVIVKPGDSVSYEAVVIDDQVDSSLPEDVKFSINRTDQRPGWNPDWDYTFIPSEVNLDSPYNSKFSTLTLTVPADSAPGVYYHTVEAKAWNEINYVMGEAGIAQVYVVNTDVNSIPEFPTVAVPVIAILGLVTIFL